MKLTEEMLYEYAPKAEKLWLNTLPPDDQIPAHTFSRPFERKMRKLLRDQRHRPAMRRAFAFAKQAAAILLIVSTISFASLMTVEAYRAKFIEVVTEIFYDLTHFSLSSSRDGDAGLGELNFGYLPDGMQETSHEEYDDSQSRIIYFEDLSGRQIKFFQQTITSVTDADVILDTENAEVTAASVNGFDAALVSKDGLTSLMWEDETYLLVLSGDISDEEMISVASNLTIEK